MIDLLIIVLPVFIVAGFGYLANWQGWFPDAAVDALMQFSQKFAIPCLLFRAIWKLDLSAHVDVGLLGSYYGAALICFGLGIAGARLIFGRAWEDSVAIGFCCLFSNSVMLGLPITERAYGTEALAGNYTIIAIHAAIAYGVGITVMEIVRARGPLGMELVPVVLRAMFKNAMIIGIGLGLVANLGQVPVPAVVAESVDLMAQAALPAALFGLGGVLCRYKPEGDLRTIAFMCGVTLFLRPALVWGFALIAGLEAPALRSAIVTAAMPPGVNAYLFAAMFGVAMRVAASTVLIATGLSVLSASVWLALLP